MLFGSTIPRRGLAIVYRQLLPALSLWLLLAMVDHSSLFAQAGWLQSKTSDGIVYFLFATPARLERYDLTTASWLTTITLPATPTAFAVDVDGIYVAFDRSVSHFPLEGGAATHLENTPTTIIDLFTINEFLYINHSAYPYGKLTSVNKFTGITIDSKDYLYKVLNGIAVGHTIGKVFARTLGSYPVDIFQITLNVDGTLGTANDSPYHGVYANATKTFLFPNQSRVVDSAGIVYNTSDLTYNNSLAGVFDDIAFYGDAPIILRDGNLISYSNSLLESGTYRHSTQLHKIYVHNDQVIAFANSYPRGVEAIAIALSSFSQHIPSSGADPFGLPYTPDAVLLGNNEILYLFSKFHLSIFRWSIKERTYLPTIWLSQEPSYFAYAPTTNRLYLAYASGKLTQIRPDNSLREEPFANSPLEPCGLATADQYLFVCNSSGTGISHLLYHPDGAWHAQVNPTYFSKAYVWSPINRKLYFFRDEIFPNDLYWQTIDSEGQFGTARETPYSTSDGIRHPIRVAPDGSVVLLGSGRIYDANSLTHVNSLSNDITDAAWRLGSLYTMRQLTEQTQIQKWGTTYALEKGVDIIGSTINLFAVDEGLLAVTNYLGHPRLLLLDDELNMIYQSPTVSGLTATNDSPAAAGKSLLFHSELKGGAGRITYAWDFGDGTQGVDQTTSHVYANAGVYTATVSAANVLETITATTLVTITTPVSNDEPITGLRAGATDPTKLGDLTYFSVGSRTGTNIRYQWSLGDGTVASGAQITHTYPAVGRYTATVTATNDVSTVSTAVVIYISPDEVVCPIYTVTLKPAATNLPHIGNMQRFKVIIDPPTAADSSLFYEFLINDAPFENNVSALPQFDYTFAEVGNYTINGIVYCPSGSMTASTNVLILPRPTAQPDLSASTVSAALANVETGDLLTYTFFLHNQQAVTAQASLSTTLPAYTTYQLDSAQTTAGAVTVTNNVLTWAGEVISGTPVLVNYAVQVEAAPDWTMFDSIGWLADQFGNTVQLKTTSGYEPGYRLLINGGALYTNQSQVTLTYRWNATHNIQFVKFSNDSGFGPDAGTTDWLPINPQNPSYTNWQLTPHPNSRLPRTVYVRFLSANAHGNQYGFQDDIILDTSPPKLLQVTWLTATQRSEQATATETQVRIMASDENSGITAVELSTQADFTMATPYVMAGNTLDVTVATPTAGLLYVRARDRAGNYSTIQTLTSGGTVQIFLPVVTR